MSAGGDVRPIGSSGRTADPLFLDEIGASIRLAGAPLLAHELAALVDRGFTSGTRRLDEYVLAADYTAAANFVRSAAPAGRRRPLLALHEVIELHALTVRRSLGDRPGTWRTTTSRPFPNGMIAPPAWRVPQAIAALADRISTGPGTSAAPLFWVAENHERFRRIQPFTTANGRVGRLVTNLLLRRLGYPSLIIGAREAPEYSSALASADSGDPWPLAVVVARGMLASLTRMRAAAHADDELRPLAALATSRERAALYKAAQRGSLPSLRRAGRLLTTRTWIDAYRRERTTAASAEGGAA
ncbi:MAG: Fic family protein [Candidatus Eremiobacteraeota bacterium]|nr:Fic family protein [Candidatus Eremiobacteraeota bacterium]